MLATVAAFLAAHEPTPINGTPVPVIMTVTVNFAMQE